MLRNREPTMQPQHDLFQHFVTTLAECARDPQSIGIVGEELRLTCTQYDCTSNMTGSRISIVYH